MNTFLHVLESSNIAKEHCLRRTRLTTLQVNMGDRCNQSCAHCHVGASPQGEKVMSREVIDSILRFLSRHSGLVLDITGGAPELNPHFDYFIVGARPLVREIMVRSNLTVFFEPGKEYLPQFFKKHSLHLICSLPCYTQQNVEAQRGKGVFNKSIQSLKMLNELGYGREEGLVLDLVYNPAGPCLPPKQDKLEKDYKQQLQRNHGVEFNRLVTITNVPIKRFKEQLDSQGEYARYLKLLKDSFNPGVVENIMCREFLSVGYDGKLYDCDFNQALCWALKDEGGKFLTLETLNAEELEGREIMVGEHCLSCTAGYGSSCQGALMDEQRCSPLLDAKEAVKEYYGKVLTATRDLKTSACCDIGSVPSYHRQILAKTHPEILEKFYGCGSPIPPVLEGCTILDLGCGTGRDVYIASALAGEKGFVIGVDMTDEQLEVARKHLNYQMQRFGFSRPNVEFRKGHIEDLKELDMEDNSVDVVISNCVINLSPDKKTVFAEILRVLKPGGELYFSDIFTGRRMPEHLKDDPVLYGECLGGALYIEDFRRLLREVSCLDYRVVSHRRITLNNQEIEAKAGMIDFYSMTIRAFKLADLEDTCEDYGQVATYRGTIPEYPHEFPLDDHHLFKSGKPVPVCGNTASMLQETRYAKHFQVTGDRSTHYGPFPCETVHEKTEDPSASAPDCCCS